MAVKSKEMTASAMKVVIRKHLVCVSSTIKTGTRRSLGACCGKREAGAVMFREGSPWWGGSDETPGGLHKFCHLAQSSFLGRHGNSPSQGLLEMAQRRRPAGHCARIREVRAGGAGPPVRLIQEASCPGGLENRPRTPQANSPS